MTTIQNNKTSRKKSFITSSFPHSVRRRALLHIKVVSSRCSIKGLHHCFNPLLHGAAEVIHFRARWVCLGLRFTLLCYTQGLLQLSILDPEPLRLREKLAHVRAHGRGGVLAPGHVLCSRELLAQTRNVPLIPANFILQLANKVSQLLCFSVRTTSSTLCVPWRSWRRGDLLAGANDIL